MESLHVHPDLAYDNRTIPADPPQFPALIGGMSVVAAVLVPARTGDKPATALVVLRAPSRPADRAFEVVTAASDGDEWSAFDRTHSLSYFEALAYLRTELSYRV